MGAYIYGLRGRKQAIEVEMGAQSVTVGTLKYVCKPYLGKPEATRRYENLAIGRARKSWGSNTPRFVITEEEPQVGAAVLHWRAGQYLINDYSSQWQAPSRTVGYLIRTNPQGDGWTVGSWDEAQFQLREDCDTKGHQGPHGKRLRDGEWVPYCSHCSRDTEGYNTSADRCEADRAMEGCRQELDQRQSRSYISSGGRE